MKRIRMLLSLALVVCFAASLALAAPFAQASGAPLTIRMFHFNTEDDVQASTIAFHAGMTRFAEKYPDVVLEQEVLAHDPYETKMKTYVAAGDLPDVFLIKGTMVKTLSDEGYIQPIDAVLESIPGWRESIKDGASTVYTYQDEIYGIAPALQSNQVIYYNTEILKSVGYDSFPDTWAGVLALIDALNETEYVPIALGNKGQWLAESCIFNTLAYRFVDDVWFENLLDNNGANFTDPEFIRALEAMRQLAEHKAFNSDMNSLENTQARQMYYTGQAAMFIEGEWAVSDMIGLAPEELIEKTSFAVFPAFPDEPLGDVNRSAGGPGWGWVINSNVEGEKLEAIRNLIYEFVGPADAAGIIIEHNANPVCVPDSYDATKMHPKFLEFMEFSEPIKFALVFDTILDPSIVDALYTNMQDLLLLSMTPQEYADLAQEALEEVRASQ